MRARPAARRPPWRPTKAQVAAAHGATVPDVIRPGLAVLFVGINPGLYSGAVGHHFARPGNRFWRTLNRAGFTDRLLSPFEERELLRYGVGITNLVPRATARGEEVTVEELRAGARRVRAKACRFCPRFVAFVGIGAYRAAFRRRDACVGRQPERLCRSSVWLLPNPSGLNAHYQVDALAEAYGELRRSSQDEPWLPDTRSPTGRSPVGHL
jgi:TDG/mug DNA glycosylase family protein